MTLKTNNQGKLKILLNRRDKFSKIVDAGFRRVLRRINNFYKFSENYTFIDRQKGNNKCLLILAGYKSYLWDYIFPRVKSYVPSNIDVCIISPGLFSEPLAKFAESNSWSYLSTKANKITLAFNLAIKLIKKADYFYKIDEDIFIPKDFFDGLFQGLQNVKDEGLYSPGFVAPVLNLNGFSYIQFLESMGLKNEYQKTFGELKRASADIQIHKNPEAAIWIWQRSLPFENISSFFSNLPFSYSVVPHRFSIGAILFERTTWELFGDLKVPIAEMDLGYDEYQICTKCVAKSKVMVVCNNVFAGHFSFYPQEKAMKEYLEKMKDGLAIIST